MLRDPWDSNKRLIFHVIQVPRGEEREWCQKKVSEEMVEREKWTCPYLQTMCLWENLLNSFEEENGRNHSARFRDWLPQCDDRRRWGPLWADEVVRAEPPWVGYCPWRGNPASSPSSLPCEDKDAGRRRPSTDQEARPRYRPSAGALVLDFSVSRTVRSKCLLFKPPNVWNFCCSSPNGLRCQSNSVVLEQLVIYRKKEKEPRPKPRISHKK